MASFPGNRVTPVANRQRSTSPFPTSFRCESPSIRSEVHASPMPRATCESRAVVEWCLSDEHSYYSRPAHWSHQRARQTSATVSCATRLASAAVVVATAAAAAALLQILLCTARLTECVRLLTAICSLLPLHPSPTLSRVATTLSAQRRRQLNRKHEPPVN